MNVDTVISLIKGTINYMNDTYNDWHDVITDGENFEKECNKALYIIDPILSNDPDFNTYLITFTRNKCLDKKVHTGRNAILVEIIKIIYFSEQKIRAFMKRNNSSKGFRLVKRTLVAREYIDYYAEKTILLRDLIDSLCKNVNFSEMVSKRTINEFKKHISADSFNFWKRSIGVDVFETDWGLFSDAYQLLYGDWDNKTLKKVKSTLCRNGGNKITFFAFMYLVDQNGFPVNATNIQEKTILSEEMRMSVAKMVMDLIAEFSSKEMRIHLLCVYKWFNKQDKRNKHEMQIRANDWAFAVLNSRSRDIPTEEDIIVDNVDIARRNISLFYQRYMVMWRVGNLSRDVFNDVDFPGKARIRDFIEYILPLDHANYHIVIKGDEMNWENKKPKIYRFLEELIK